MQTELMLKPEEMTATRLSLVAAADNARALLSLPGMTMTIQGNRYIGKDGSVALGQMLGLYPIQEQPDGIFGGEADEHLLGFHATCRIVDRAGAVRAEAHAICMLDETVGKSRRPRWESDSAAYSMSQTRALVKAYGMVVASVVALADMDVSSTPAEEMPYVPDSVDKFAAGRTPKAMDRKAKPAPVSPDPPPDDRSPADKRMDIVDQWCRHNSWLDDTGGQRDLIAALMASPEAKVHFNSPEKIGDVLRDIKGWMPARMAILAKLRDGVSSE